MQVTLAHNRISGSGIFTSILCTDGLKMYGLIHNDWPKNRRAKLKQWNWLTG